jgi:hypothetical protein
MGARTGQSNYHIEIASGRGSSNLWKRQTSFFAAIASRPNPTHVALARAAHRRDPIDPAEKLIGTNEVRPC